MRWPWVSRRRLEEVEKRLLQTEIERKLLFDMVAEKDTHTVNVPAGTLALDEARGLRITEAEMPVAEAKQGFGNPFDRIEAAVKQKIKAGGIPARYKAR